MKADSPSDWAVGHVHGEVHRPIVRQMPLSFWQCGRLVSTHGL